MVTYLIKTPYWLQKLFPKQLIWSMPAEAEPSVYITFDDGPHPTATPYILEQLDKYDAKATFFCIGKNVVLYSDVYKQTLEKGHTIGNHTHNHLNGWKNDNATYRANIDEATKYIDSHCFRPPYGKIKRSQAKELAQSSPAWKIYMWNVLSADFDRSITPEKCLRNVLKNIEPGSIVIFHDSDKAWDRMSYALPRVLEFCKQKNWKIKALPKY